MKRQSVHVVTRPVHRSSSRAWSMGVHGVVAQGIGRFPPMATYGPGRGRSSKQTTRSRSASASSRARTDRSDRSGAVDRTERSDRVDATGRVRRGSGAASADIREAIGGREHEFAGVGLIVAGILIGLAVYFDVAGPLGRGIETLIGWFTGLGRFVVPIALIGAGAALVHRGRSDNRPRLVLGYFLAALSILGLLHVVRGPEKLMADFDAFGTAGGWFGALIGEPMRNLIADAGAIVVFVALFLLGVLLITGSTIRQLMSQTGRSAAAVATPLGKVARTARDKFGDIATLRSERDGAEPLDPYDEDLSEARPSLYDADADDDWSDVAPKSKPKRKAKAVEPVVYDGGDGEQAELELGPGAARGAWVLPPANYLNRTENQTINKAEVEARGTTLVEALASHGVETRTGRHDRGSHRHPLRARARPGRQGGPRHQPQPRHRLRDGGGRRAHPRPHPGPPAIGVEVPNHTRQLVTLGDIMTSPEAARRDAPARGGRRQGHRRPGGVPEPRHHAAPAHRRHHRRGQVERHQLHHHLAPDAHHARAGAHDPDRPEAGRDGSVQPPAAPAHPAGHQPEEGGQRAQWAVQGDGAPLRRALRGRLPRHRRLQRRGTTGATSSARRCPACSTTSRRSTSGCRTSWSSSTSSTT
jgi:hypothetical protein